MLIKCNKKQFKKELFFVLLKGGKVKMEKIDKLKKDLMLDKSILSDLRWLKEEEMEKLTKKEKHELNSLYNDMREKEHLLYKEIDSVPKMKVRNNIKGAIDAYLEDIEDINSYFQGKYFKEGVIYGINIILETYKAK